MAKLDAYFKGPLHVQLRNALEYCKNLYIQEEVRKVDGQAEAIRFYNYPYEALEEAIANAVYHKDYQKPSPIEIRILHDKIEVLSFPGPLPPTTKETLMSGKVSNRDYRNRRVGDFLKELHLTEGRCTGLRKIQNRMKKNGSSPAVFDTDEDRTFFMTILPVHEMDEKIEKKRLPIPKSLLKRVDELGERPNSNEVRAVILEICQYGTFTSQELTHMLGKKNKDHMIRTYLNPLVQSGKLKLSYPEDPRHPNQSYGI